MHVLIERQWLVKALTEHRSRTGEDHHALVDRLLTGFFAVDAPWAKNGTWETPFEIAPRRQTKVNGGNG